MIGLTYLIDQISQFLSTFTSPVIYFLKISLVLGQFLFETIVSLVGTCLGVVTSFQTLCGIFWDDYLFFINDFITNVTHLVSSISVGSWLVYKFGVDIYFAIWSTGGFLIHHVGYTCGAIHNFFAALLNGLWTTLTLLCGGICFIGSTAINAVVIIPEAVLRIALIPAFCAKVIRHCGNSILIYVHEIDNNIYQYFLSIPINAYAGCFIGLVVCYLLIVYLTDIASYIFDIIKRGTNALWRIISQCWTGEFFQSRRDAVATFPRNNITQELPIRSAVRRTLTEDQSLCIVCLTAPKNVLYLPCRHLCLCNGCTSMLNSSMCPLCRKKVRRTMIVYV